MPPEITRIEAKTFSLEIEDFASEDGLNTSYKTGVHAVGDRVGDEMDLMLDPACDYETFAEALQVGRACDAQEFEWYEDPLRDAGQSQHAARKLREKLDTPLLMTEMSRGLESHTDFVATDATDFVRADPRWDGGMYLFSGTVKSKS